MYVFYMQVQFSLMFSIDGTKIYTNSLNEIYNFNRS